MDIQVNEIENNITYIKFKGRSDAGTMLELGNILNEIIDNGAQKLLCNFEEAIRIDSGTIGALINAKQRLVKDNGNLVISNLNDIMKNVFRTTMLTEIFDILETEEEAKNVLNN